MPFERDYREKVNLFAIVFDFPDFNGIVKGGGCDLVLAGYEFDAVDAHGVAYIL